MVAYGSTTVYVIGPAGGPMKIGYANNAERRRDELQIGNHADLAIHCVARVPSETARQIEAGVHKRLADRNRRGEWFDVTVEEARAAISAVSDVVIAEWQGPLQRSTDQIEQLFATHKLHRWTREAVTYYRRLMNGSPADRELASRADVFVAKRAGAVALNLLLKVVVERMDLYSLLGGAGGPMRRAREGLADAVNSLAEWYAVQRELIRNDIY